MNPFTESLLKNIDDDELVAWVSNWDALESIVIDVFRAGEVHSSHREKYRWLKKELIADYQTWQDGLELHWQGRQAGGVPIDEDPFLELLSVSDPAEYVDNWEAMQLLPAARESLNSYLLARIEAQDGNRNG